ncbi:hypothetical protein TNCV_2787191 [Trichonephila clavipes]|uniref:Uncharacterized protein n=1 Tax=Trichonephila clavipes TaxID=2585209 RepID=A0A8X6SMQ7_TRICX|nr:hypothetical protein TNCV_2787191 [Trichonephila clavipes]
MPPPSETFPAERRFYDGHSDWMHKGKDRGSLVVKVTDSWMACHEFEPSPAVDPSCRGGEAMHVKSIDAQTSSRDGVVWKFGEGVPAHVSSSSLDRGSKERGSSPKVLEQLNSAKLI